MNTKRSRIENIPRGRPRTAGHDAAILEAALRLMARDGYARMSVDAIAAEAGVSKAALYRRWSGKAEVATAALAHLRDRREPPSSADARADLLEELERFRTGIERPFGMAMLGTVLAEEHHNPELLALFREHVVEPRRRRLREILERLPLRLDPETAASLLVGSYYASYLAGGPPPVDWAERLVGALLD